MPTTTNNGWDIPADTDLVKNGALAIRTLGQDIDTTLGVYAQAGLVKLNTTTFTAVASQSINSVFTSTYTNYKIMFAFTTSSGVDLSFRLRASGTDATTNYEYAGFRITTGSAQTLNGSAAAGSYIFISATGVGLLNTSSMELFRPQEAAFTAYSSIGQGYAGGASRYTAELSNGLHTTATSYDGFTFYPGGGTMTGSVSVYGFNK